MVKRIGQIILLVFAFAILTAAQDKNDNTVINGKAVYLVRPEYPQEARDHSIGGVVYVRVVIDSATGEVLRTKAVFGPEALRASCEKAALSSKFKKSVGRARKNPYYSGVVVYNFVPQN